MEATEGLTMTGDPATKYADNVDPEHRAVMDLVLGAARNIGLVENHLRKLDKAERDSHSIMHITNSTLYRDMIYSKRFAAQMKVVRAALRFADEIKNAADEVEAEMAAEAGNG